MDKETVQDRIDAILRKLKEAQSALASLPDRRDSAYQAYLDLEALRAPATAVDAETIDRMVSHASQIAWALYEALHQEYQHDLEWARSPGNGDNPS